SALWDTLMVPVLIVPTSRAVSTSPSMEERIGRAFSIWDQRSGFQIWRSVPALRRFCLPAHGIRGGLRGARMLRSMDRVAVFTGLKMGAKRGLASMEMEIELETGCPEAIGGGLASRLRRTASACT